MTIPSRQFNIRPSPITIGAHVPQNRRPDRPHRPLPHLPVLRGSHREAGRRRADPARAEEAERPRQRPLRRRPIPTTRTRPCWPGSPTAGSMRTAYLSMTRGDGGQNLLGDEQGPRLGVIRTQELLAARRIDGAEQYFTRAIDFGYSKGPGETLRHLGTRHGPRRRRLGHPQVPARRHRHPLSDDRRGRPRPPHGLGDPGGRGVHRGGGPDEVSPSSSTT